MTLLAFFIVIVALVLVHELGHFLAAKRAGIRVDEFGIGFPPRLFGIQKGETLYSVNALPFGGFVKLHGEDGEEEGSQDPRSFAKASKYHKTIVMAAGVAFNFIFAWMLLSVGYMIGIPASPLVDPRVEGSALTVTQVLPETPAFDAGFKPGDEIISVDTGEKVVLVRTAEETSALIVNGGGELSFLVERGDEQMQLDVTPTIHPETGTNFVGIGMDTLGTLSLPLHEALYEGGKTTITLSTLIVAGLADLIRDAFVGQADLQSVTGPVGIAGLAGDALRVGVVEFISFTAIISIHLAILNLIPIPALDGGRLVVLGLEAIRRKPIPTKIVATINMASFALLILLMLFVTYRDVVRLF
ncbi:MAG: RIP metalloprotease RseP [Candidatus Zambryskibacteria bacterium CG10_big_fil_rev_8_21_14_0_10_42_12]|uniref:Zinc metalloprotease n=1 Tax=Candidatus Zambryskibacteria bacterium CG10_big_fil_rev_8_21_14_0_10_42_12 TaxID=1975115 RepID=A0A2H0QUE9_9BACT|nr:MAG: RIP metalloprotease RseP [Candidatus Zambryskibacteria bacterium CG10_big_fil_rev_8_21_14_0_10_42_12]